MNAVFDSLGRVEILSRLGFDEIPKPNTIEYVCYYITYNSCWYCDYLTRYFSSYSQTVMAHTNNPENYDKILRAAMIEYQKLKRYIYHVYEKNTPPNMNMIKYNYYYYDSESCRQECDKTEFIYSTLKNEEVTTNRYMLTQMYNNSVDMKNLKEKIYEKTYEYEYAGNQHISFPKSFIHNFSILESNSSSEIIPKDIYAVEARINKIENQILNLEKQKRELISWKNNYYELKDNQQLLKKFERKNNLYIRTFQFNIQTIEPLPNEIISIIRDYVGEEFIENVRRYSITQTYFPSPISFHPDQYENNDHIKDSLENMLKKWRVVDIISYSKQTYIRYDIYNEGFKWRRRSLRTTSPKSDAIKHVLRGTHKHTFYEFQRDIILLSRFISENKITRRRISRGRTQISIIT